MHTMHVVRRLQATEWQVYKQLRLRGLVESPDAFGSTVAFEQQRTDEEWQHRVSTGALSPSDLPLLALGGNASAGLAWAKVDQSNASLVNLFQMWVAPEHRGNGLGKQLLRMAISWALARNAEAVCLGVALRDGPAMHLYRAAGFVPNGETEPLRPGSPVLAQPMRLRLAASAVQPLGRADSPRHAPVGPHFVLGQLAHTAGSRSPRTLGRAGDAVPVGYSGTPLPKKLGITASTRLAVLGGPGEYESILGELPVGAKVSSRLGAGTNIVHLFVTQREALATELSRLRKALHPEATVWISWPKKASKVPTTVTEDVIRELALPLGFVDVKVCAVTEVWSGLKLVVRKELRAASAA